MSNYNNDLLIEQENEITSLRDEVEALREALRLALVNAYSPEDVIEITEAALTAAGRE